MENIIIMMDLFLKDNGKKIKSKSRNELNNKTKLYIIILFL